MVALKEEKNGGFISSSNFSLGVNIFLSLMRIWQNDV
jgi:dihydrodipicolinate reductase